MNEIYYGGARGGGKFLTARMIFLRIQRNKMCKNGFRRDYPCICGSPWRHAQERAMPKIVSILSETNAILSDLIFVGGDDGKI